MTYKAIDIHSSRSQDCKISCKNNIAVGFRENSSHRFAMAGNRLRVQDVHTSGNEA